MAIRNISGALFIIFISVSWATCHYTNCKDELEFSVLTQNWSDFRVNGEEDYTLPYLPSIIPTPDAPISDPFQKALLSAYVYINQLLPLESIKANPASRIFPGDLLKESETGSKTVNITVKDKTMNSLLSTGFYVPPGRQVRITLKSQSGSLFTRLQIGAHSDDFRLGPAIDAPWQRSPKVTVTTDWLFLDSSKSLELQMVNPFGGQLYIIPSETFMSQLEVTVDGAITAPRFILSQTSIKDWQMDLENTGAP